MAKKATKNTGKRLSDDDRERYAEHLREAHTTGQLGDQELEIRLEMVYEAVREDDLDGVLEGLDDLQEADDEKPVKKAAKKKSGNSRVTPKKAKLPVEEPSIEYILQNKKPSVLTVKFLLNPELRELERKAQRRVGDAELAIIRAERREGPVPDELIDELEEARSEHAEIVEDEEFAVFRLVAMGGDPLEDLMTAHRPSIKQQKEFAEELKRQGLPQNETLLYDPDTFPPALLHECCASPKMTIEQAKQLWKSPNFNRGELGELFKAAWSVNQAITA